MKKMTFWSLSLMLSLISLSMSSCSQAQAISTEEADELQFMIQEEKMARDLYRQFYAQTGIQAFQNIAEAEQRHMDKIAGLLKQSALANPVENMAEGVFENEEIKKLYQELLNRAAASTIDALKTAAFVEEKDIEDLRAVIESSNQSKHISVLQHLEEASKRHLQAFARQLKNRGVDYEAQVLDKDEVHEILASDQRGGRGYRGGRGQ
jgi:hypothetical protein